MSEATGLEAKTVHQLLEAKPPDIFQRNEDNPLSGDVLIVDEASMLDIVLTYHLLKAVPPMMTVILVGDIDQLPSVGPGNVLRDIVDSGVALVVKLEQIYRQAAGSRIIQTAHQINKGDLPDLQHKNDSDFFFIGQEEKEPPALIAELCSRRLPGRFGFDPVRDIQVLSPMQQGDCGVNNLNNLLQETPNPDQPFIRFGGREFRLKDKVLQIRNNYDKETFNALSFKLLIYASTFIIKPLYK